MLSHIKYLSSVYVAFLRVHFGISVMYRAQLVIYVLSGLLPLIMMAVWLSIARDQPSGEVGGFSRSEFISYYLAVLVMRRLCGVWIIWDIDEDIRLGRLSSKLLRPIHPAHNYLAMGVTDKPVEMAFLLPPVVVAVWLTGATYDFSPLNLFYVSLAILGAIGIEYGVSMAVGALGFWITQTVSVMEIWFYSRAFLSGWIIPIALFPEGLQQALIYLPYRYVLSFQIEIAMGQLTPSEIWQGFLIQWLWVAVLSVGFQYLWSIGIKRFSAVGA
ncbi:MAG: ABC-2 family transporter protein [Chloroflexota bacterium]